MEKRETELNDREKKLEKFAVDQLLSLVKSQPHTNVVSKSLTKQYRY